MAMGQTHVNGGQMNKGDTCPHGPAVVLRSYLVSLKVIVEGHDTIEVKALILYLHFLHVSDVG